LAGIVPRQKKRGRKNIFIQAMSVPLCEVKDVEKSGFSFAQRQKLLIIGSENKLFR
jgi:hypothetical protein